MQKTWALNDAKTQFSEVIELAQSEPQVVTKHGKKTAVVMSFEAYQNLLPKISLWDMLRPTDPVLEDDDPDPFERLPAVMREIDFDD
jgi:prevent-host-death family protein